MTDPTPLDRADLERLLVDLGHALDLPPAPDPTARVLARLAAPPEPGWRRPRVAALVAAVLVALLALTPPGQAAVAQVIDAFGVVSRLGAPSAPHRPERLPGETAVAGSARPSPGGTGSTSPGSPDTRSPLERAADQVSFPVVAPAGLGLPDQVTVSDGGRVLSLLYGPGPGRPPAGPGGVSARLDEFAGTLDLVFLKTITGPVEYVDLPGAGPAVWIAAPHDVAYLDRDGVQHTESAHLASRTLIWQAGSVTLRLEGDFTRDDALAVAQSPALTPTR